LEEQPFGDVATGGEGSRFDDTAHRAGLVPNRDDVPGLHPVRGDVDLAPVDLEMAVRDELPGLVPAHRQTTPVDHVVEPELQELQQPGAGHPLGVRGLFVVAAELLLEHAVDTAGLLLLAELNEVLALLDPSPAVL